MPNPFPFLRRIGHLEAISFLLLLAIAMPLKYLADRPEAVKYVGWAHGVLFILYGLALLRAWIATRWPIVRPALLFLAAFFPFGPFIADRWLHRWEQDWLNKSQH